MKIAFVHSGKDFAEELLGKLRAQLSDHEIISWEEDEEAPANDFEIALVMGKFTREQMTGQAKLMLVQTVSAGYDAIDVEAATEMGIWVSYSPSGVTGNAISVAEFAMLLLLGASRQLNQVLQPLRNPAITAPGISAALYGKTVCIVGLGTIGRLLADRLKPFGPKITATDDHPKQVPEGITVFHTSQLLEAVADADYVVLCVRATEANENLVNAAALSAMKPGAILVNIARGSLLDEAALLNSIKSGHIRAVGLDVLKNEPVDSENPLLSMPQVLITPHVAGTTDLTLNGMANYATQVINDISTGKKPKSLVNNPGKPRHYY